jgi:hypothetical protein
MKRRTWSIGIVACVALTTGAGCGATISLGASCGGNTIAPCFGPFFCFYESGCGDAGEAGLCQPVPGICIEIFQPVCGCDGETYSNQCMAWANSANVAADGECEQTP